MRAKNITDFKSIVVLTDGTTTEYTVTHSTLRPLENLNIRLIDTTTKQEFLASVEVADSDTNNKFKVVFETPYPNGSFTVIIK